MQPFHVRHQVGQGERGQALIHQARGRGHRFVQCVVHGAVNQALGRRVRSRISDHALAKGTLLVVQGDGGRLALQPPAATMTLGGSDDAGLALAGEGAAYHHWIGVHASSQVSRGHRGTGSLYHVQQSVQGERQGLVELHVTFIITLTMRQRKWPAAISIAGSA